MLAKHPAEKAFTLVELLVVMFIIAALAAILMALWPDMSGNSVNANAAAVQAMLLTAKQEAARSKRPYGVRLIATGTNVTQLMYIWQPEPFTQAGSVLTGISGGVAQFSQANFTGGFSSPTDYPVQLGDYLEYNSGGLMRKISGVSQASLSLQDSTFSAPTGFAATSNFRIIRQPRPASGEKPLDLTNHVVIDLSASVPQNTAMDIVFSPSGSVIASGSQGNDKIVLWVRNLDFAQTAGNPVLIGIQIGTGYVGSYQVDMSNPTGNPPFSGSYLNNTRDPPRLGDVGAAT